MSRATCGDSAPAFSALFPHPMASGQCSRPGLRSRRPWLCPASISSLIPSLPDTPAAFGWETWVQCPFAASDVCSAGSKNLCPLWWGLPPQAQEPPHGRYYHAILQDSEAWPYATPPPSQLISQAVGGWGGRSGPHDLKKEQSLLRDRRSYPGEWPGLDMAAEARPAHPGCGCPQSQRLPGHKLSGQPTSQAKGEASGGRF